MIAWLPWLLLFALFVPGPLEVCAGQADGDAFCNGDGITAPDVAARHGGTISALSPAKGRFLTASRSLIDPNFAESVILLLAYDAHGAMGIVVNRPTDVRLASALPDIQELRDRPDRVHLGGPVGGNLMLVLVRSPTLIKPAEKIFADVYVTGSATALRKVLGKGGKTNRLRAYAGHAGWGPGQLDREIARGDWLVTAADAATVFETPASDIWPKLIERFSGEWAEERGMRSTSAISTQPTVPPRGTACGAAFSAFSKLPENL